MSRTENPPLPQPAGAGSGGGGGRRRTGRGSDGPPRPGRGPSGGAPGPPGGRLDTTRAFLRSILAELRRVDWPGATEVRAATIVVLACLVLVAGYVGLWEWLLAKVFGTPAT